MSEINWRQSSVALLTANPTEWRRLADIFAAVEQDIPIHYALRYQDTKIRAQAKQGKVTPELGVHAARWKLFLSHMLPLIERRAECGVLTYSTKQTDLVRLRAHSEPCDKCGGPRYLTAIPARGLRRRYNCPACTEPEPIPEPVSEPEEVAPEPTPEPEPAPVIVAPPAPKPPIKIAIVHKPKPVPTPAPAPKPAPTVLMVARPLGLLCSLQEIWDEFERCASMPKFQDNPKLRRMLHRAMEAGAVDQYCRLLANDTAEIAALGYPDGVLMVSVWNARGSVWARAHCVPHQVRRWGELIVQIYGFTGCAILQIVLNGHIKVISKEMERLINVLHPRPSPKPRLQPRQRWTAMIKGAKNVVSHWRIR